MSIATQRPLDRGQRLALGFGCVIASIMAVGAAPAFAITCGADQIAIEFPEGSGQLICSFLNADETDIAAVKEVLREKGFDNPKKVPTVSDVKDAIDDVKKDEDDDDPRVTTAVRRSSGFQASSASTGALGTTPSSSATSTAVDGHLSFNPARYFQLGYQGLRIAPTFSYDNTKINYGPGSTIFDQGSVRRNTYKTGVRVSYFAGDWYVGTVFAYNWGDGSITDAATGALASFNSRGYSGMVVGGRVFTLIDNIRSYNPPVVGKAAAAPSSKSGYAVRFDFGALLGTSTGWDSAFTDTAGAVVGEERLRYNNAGARARLYADILAGNLTWTPSIAATYEQRFGYSHTIDIPAQAGSAADQISFNEAKTFWGGDVGISARDVSGIQVGAKAFAQASADTHIYGASAFVSFPLLNWLSLHGTN